MKLGATAATCALLAACGSATDDGRARDTAATRGMSGAAGTLASGATAGTPSNTAGGMPGTTSGSAGALNQAGAGSSSAGASVSGSGGTAGATATGAGAGGLGGAGRGASGGASGASGGTGRGGSSAGGHGGAAGGAASAGRGGNAGAAGSGGALTPLTVFIAGDSTAMTYTDTASTMDQAGWGQMLGSHFASVAKVDNRAIGGRTARRFIDEGHLEEIGADLRAGDYLLVQFGTNDSNKTATYDLDGQAIPYYLDPETDFKTYLRQYFAVAGAHGATAVLVTPTPRNSAYCTGGNGTGAWATAMRELGASDGIAVLDLNQRTVDYLKAICPSPTPEDFFLVKSDGSVDGTHFQENGARILAGFVADAITSSSLPLAAYVR